MMGPASEPEPVRLEDHRNSGCEPAADTTAVPDVRVIAVIRAAIDDPESLIGRCSAEESVLSWHARAVQAALARAGWVLVPGPVHDEFAYRYPDGATSYPASRQKVERLLAADVSAIAVVRQATEWRPAESTQEGHQ